MQYEHLHRRYGTHISQRVKRELTPAEFGKIDIAQLPDWLQQRAEAAHNHYRRLLNNPLASSDSDTQLAGAACRRWRDAEDLAYLVVIAQDVSVQARA